MELLAFVHTAVNYEDPAPDPEVRLPNFDLKVPGSAGVAMAGVAMAVAAVSASPGQAFAATTAVSVGSTGTEVANVQKALGVNADSHFGAKTEAAVMDFQIRQGLKQVDGVVGKETATALGLDETYRPTYLGYVDTNSGIGLNVRGGPGIDYRRIGGLDEGTVVETYGEVIEGYYYDWQRVAPDAWVAIDYVEPYYQESGYYDDYDYGYREYGYDGYYDGDCYEPVSYWDEGYYSPYSYTDGGGYVETNTGIGLNIRSGPGLEYYIEDAVPDGTYLPTVDGTVYRQGYAWEELPDGNWVASDYLE